MNSEDKFPLMSFEEIRARLAAVQEVKELDKAFVEELEAFERAKSPAGTIPVEQVEAHLKTLKAIEDRAAQLQPLLDPATLPKWLQSNRDGDE